MTKMRVVGRTSEGLEYEIATFSEWAFARDCAERAAKEGFWTRDLLTFIPPARVVSVRLETVP